MTDLDRARDGDGAAFTRLVAPLRRELHAHRYRMLGSTHDAGPGARSPHLAWSIDVLTVRAGLIAEVTSFIGAGHRTACGLPAELT